MRDALASTADFPGVTGAITFDADRNPVKAAVMLQVEKGKFRYVASVAPGDEPAKRVSPGGRPGSS